MAELRVLRTYRYLDAAEIEQAKANNAKAKAGAKK